MIGRSLIISFHAWRGLHRDGGVLGAIWVCGWISVTWVPFLVDQWIRDKIERVRSATRQVPKGRT